MGLLDNILNEVAPGGQLTPQAKAAIGTLLTDVAASGGSQTNPQGGNANPVGEVVGGLAGILQNLQAAGHGDAVNSWTQPGPNAPIDPNHLGAAIGQQNVSNAAQQAGISEQQLLTQLAQAIPALVNKLSSNGQLPNPQQLAALMQRQ
jgi:uncharacterized protein YidB (DUF937 family)